MRYFIILVLSLFMTSVAYAESAYVKKVIDGQTIELLDGRIVRLLGVNITEGNHDDIMDYDEAAYFLKSIIEKKVVELEYDIEQFDENGHHFAYVWSFFPYEGALDNLTFPDNYQVNYRLFEGFWPEFYVFVNATLIKSGYATPSSETTRLEHTNLFEQLHKEYLTTRALVRYE